MYAGFTFSLDTVYIHPVSHKKQATFIGPIFIFFTVKFRKDLWRKLELKLTPPLKSVAALPCEKSSTKQLYIYISKNNKLHVGRHLFHEFYLLIFFFQTLMFLQRYCNNLCVVLVMPFNSYVNVQHNIEHCTISAFIEQHGTQSGQINQHQMQQLHLSGLMHGSIQLLSTSHSSLTQPSVLLVSTYIGVCGPC